MFLLIQISKKEQKNNKHIFKFHYVSINSNIKKGTKEQQAHL